MNCHEKYSAKIVPPEQVLGSTTQLQVDTYLSLRMKNVRHFKTVIVLIKTCHSH